MNFFPGPEVGARERERERERERSLLTIKKRLKVGKYNALSGKERLRLRASEERERRLRMIERIASG